MDLLCCAKLLKVCISVMLGQGHLAIEKLFHSYSGMIDLWVTRAILILCSGSIADKILLYKQHRVLFQRVNS